MGVFVSNFRSRRPRHMPCCCIGRALASSQEFLSVFRVDVPSGRRINTFTFFSSFHKRHSMVVYRWYARVAVAVPSRVVLAILAQRHAVA